MTYLDAIMVSSHMMSLYWAVLCIFLVVLTPAIITAEKSFKAGRWFVFWLSLAFLFSIAFILTSTPQNTQPEKTEIVQETQK